MKKSSIPALRIEPALLAAAESVLHEDESMCSFVEQSLRLGIGRRRLQQEFTARGLASGLEAGRTGEYIDADEVLRELDEMRLDQERNGHR